LAAVLVLLIGVIMVVVGVLAVRTCLRAVRRRHQRQMWDDLVARHLELDHELDKIWLRR
jgi:hypothetical protein